MHIFQEKRERKIDRNVHGKKGKREKQIVDRERKKVRKREKDRESLKET